MLAGIDEVLIISTPDDINGFKRLIKDGSQFGITVMRNSLAQTDLLKLF